MPMVSSFLAEGQQSTGMTGFVKVDEKLATNVTGSSIMARDLTHESSVHGQVPVTGLLANETQLFVFSGGLHLSPRTAKKCSSWPMSLRTVSSWCVATIAGS